MADYNKKDDDIFKKAMLILVRLCAVIVIVLAAAIGLSLGIQNMKISYELENLKKELKILELNNKELYIKIAQRTNFVYLENIARHKLKMIQPKAIKYIYIKNNNIVNEKDF